MKIVAVTFEGTGRVYEFRTNLPLIVGARYKAVADEETVYTNPIRVVGFHDKPQYLGNLRELTRADCIEAPQMKDDKIKAVYFNEKKGTTTVVWKDGVKTTVRCHKDDTFNKEAGLALCYMKRIFDNRGAFNEVLKRYCE